MKEGFLLGYPESRMIWSVRSTSNVLQRGSFRGGSTARSTLTASSTRPARASCCLCCNRSFLQSVDSVSLCIQCFPHGLLVVEVAHSATEDHVSLVLARCELVDSANKDQSKRIRPYEHRLNCFAVF